jgi:hypothetical protein
LRIARATAQADFVAKRIDKEVILKALGD